jgi:hypothetical protein
MKSPVVALGLVIALTGCNQGLKNWSQVEIEKDGTKTIATTGLCVSQGKNDVLSFRFGPAATFTCWPESPEGDKDGPIWDMSRAKPWVLEKDGQTIELFQYAFYDYQIDNAAPRENIAIWRLLTSPGCATLKASLREGKSKDEAIVYRTYKFCDVARAVEVLKESQRSSR